MLYWIDVSNYLRKDLANVWSDEVKRDFEGIKKETQRIAFILERLHNHYRTDKERYHKEISDIINFLSHLKKVKATPKWIKQIHDDLQQIINDIEEEKTIQKQRYFDISREPYGKFLATPVGMGIIESNKNLTESILNSLYRRILDLEKIDPKHQTSGWEYSDRLSPHLDNVRFRYVGEGAEGQVLQFFYPGTSVMIKFYNFDPNHLEGRGIGLFLKLLKVPVGTKYYTPEPYFATNFLCAMQDFSSFPEYFTFIKKYPEEKKRLDKYLKQLIKEDPVEIDVTQIVHPEDRTSEDKASIFIVKYNPKAKKNEDRFKIGGVDLI